MLKFKQENSKEGSKPIEVSVTKSEEQYIIELRYDKKSSLDLSPLLIFTDCNEYRPVWDNKQSKVLEKKPCGQAKFLYFTDLKRNNKIS